jgi:hypothetical protein
MSPGVRRPPPPPRGFVKRYSLSIVLAALFLVSWVGQLFVQIPEFHAEQHAHGEPFAWGDFWIVFARATLENWQSEFLQLLTFVSLASVFVHVGSSESKTSDDELKAAIADLDAKVDRLLNRPWR